MPLIILTDLADVRDAEPRVWFRSRASADDALTDASLRLWTVTPLSALRDRDLATCVLVDRPTVPERAPLDLAALEAATGSMSAAPWLWSARRLCIDTAQVATDGTRHDLYEITAVDGDEAWPMDAAGIVALRNAKGALFAEVRSLRDDLAARDARIAALESIVRALVEASPDDDRIGTIKVTTPDGRTDYIADAARAALTAGA